MDAKDITAISGVLFGGFSLLFAALRERRRNAFELLKLDFSKLEKFIETRGLLDLVKFFEGTQPDQITKILSQSVQAADNLKLVVAQYGSLNKALAVAKLDEPTFRIHQLIEANEKLYSRFQEYRPSKAFLRKHVVNLTEIHDVIRKEKSIFIESGSTLSYVALAIIDSLQELRHDCDTNPLRVCTNNIIVYILLLFAKHVEPRLLTGHPSNPYGATYGSTFVSPQEGDVCDEKEVMRFLEENRVSALFTTGSVLDLQFGPHVSSPANHKIKRILIEYARRKSCLNFFMIAAEKINNDIADNKELSTRCKLIFDANGDHQKSGSRDKAQAEWQSFMSNEKNLIITGSPDKACVASLKEKFVSDHQEYADNLIPFDDGALLLIRGGKVNFSPVA